MGAIIKMILMMLVGDALAGGAKAAGRAVAGAGIKDAAAAAGRTVGAEVAERAGSRVASSAIGSAVDSGLSRVVPHLPGWAGKYANSKALTGAAIGGAAGLGVLGAQTVPWVMDFGTAEKNEGMSNVDIISMLRDTRPSSNDESMGVLQQRSDDWDMQQALSRYVGGGRIV